MSNQEGTTSIFHDTEQMVNVPSCATAGCYTRQIKYSATTRQMALLADISASCQQYFKVHNNCLFAHCIVEMMFILYLKFISVWIAFGSTRV